MAVVLAGASSSAQQPLDALGAPVFVEVRPECWTTFPASTSVNACGSGLSVGRPGGLRGLDISLPAGWTLLTTGDVPTRFHMIRDGSSVRLQAATALRWKAPDGRASLDVRATDPGSLEIAWRATDSSAITDVTLKVRGLESEATEALLAGSMSWETAWIPVSEGTYRPTMSMAQAAAGGVLVQELVFGTFMGGDGSEGVWDLELAPNGDLIAVGGSNSLDFPTTPRAFDTAGDAATDATLLGLSPDGTTLRFATFFGGSARDNAFELAIDCDGSLVVAGITESSDFPITPGTFDTSWNGFVKNPFVARFTSDGSALLSSTYIGGSNLGTNETVRYLEIDPADGTVLLSGGTCSSAWPTTPGALNPDYMGNCDGYITRLSPDLSEVLASSFFGTPGDDSWVRMAIATDGSILVSGVAFTPPSGIDFTLLGTGAFPDATASDVDYLASVSPDLSAVNWATWVPGSLCIHPRPDGSVVLVGATRTPAFPTTPGAYGEHFLVDTGEWQFAACSISGDGEQLLWSTIIPSDPLLFIHTSTAVDDQGRVYLASAMSTANYPFTPDAFDTTITGLSEPHISVLSADGSELLYASLIGKGAFSNEIDIFLTPDGCNGAYVTGRTSARDWPVTEGAFDETYNGSTDAWIVRMIVDNPWTHLGGALPGVKGRPELGASGPLCAGDPTSLDIVKGPDLGTAFLVLGLSELGAPLKGGTLVPAPDFLKPLALDANGARTLAFPWPAGTPSGLQLWLQAWMPDAAAPLGFSATNGVRASVP